MQRWPAFRAISHRGFFTTNRGVGNVRVRGSHDTLSEGSSTRWNVRNHVPEVCYISEKEGIFRWIRSTGVKEDVCISMSLAANSIKFWRKGGWWLGFRRQHPMHEMASLPIKWKHEELVFCQPFKKKEKSIRYIGRMCVEGCGRISRPSPMTPRCWRCCWRCSRCHS